MKKNTHPEYQDVLFVDSSTGRKFVCGSSLKTDEKEVFEGKEYPVCRVSISSTSHPFFTGSTKFVDAEGRVDKFRKRYSAMNKSNDKEGEQEEKKEEKPEEKKAGKRKKA